MLDATFRFTRLPLATTSLAMLTAVALFVGLPTTAAANPKADNRQQPNLIDAGFTVTSLAFSPDGKQLAASGHRGIAHLYATDSGKLARELKIPFPQQNINEKETTQGCDHIAFSPDGKRLAGLFNAEWDFVRGPQNQRTNFFGMTRGIVIWNPTSGRIDGTIELARRIGMVAAGKNKAQGADAAGGLDSGLTREEGVRNVAFAAQGKRVIGDLGYIYRVGRQGKQRPGNNPEQKGQDIGDGALNDGKDAVTFVAAAGPDDVRITVSPRGLVQFWDSRNKKLGKAKTKAQVTRAGRTSLRCVAISFDGTLFAIGATDGVRLFDVAKKKSLKGIRTGKKKPGPVLSVALTANGHLLATAHENGTVKLWNPRSRKELKSVEPTAKEAPQARAVAFSPDGNRLAIARGKQIELVDVSALVAAAPSE